MIKQVNNLLFTDVYNKLVIASLETGENISSDDTFHYLEQSNKITIEAKEKFYYDIMNYMYDKYNFDLNACQTALNIIDHLYDADMINEQNVDSEELLKVLLIELTKSN